MNSYQAELLELRYAEREQDMRTLIDLMQQFAREVQRLRPYEDAWRRVHGNADPKEPLKENNAPRHLPPNPSKMGRRKPKKQGDK